MNGVPVGIAGLGKHLPERALTNFDLEKMVDTSDEWIVQRTGIRERRIAGENENTSDMCAAAARQALEDANVRPEEIGLVLVCTVTGDHQFPATACEVARQIGATNAGGWDIGGACAGFIFGVQSAAGLIASGIHDAILVIGAEKLSAIMDYTDRTTCVIFGDGAGAAVITSLERAGGMEILGSSVGIQPDRDSIILPVGGTRLRPTHEAIEERQHFVKMEGSKVYRFAVKTFAELVSTAMKPYGYEELGLVIPHQVNQRIIEAAAERLALPMDKFFVNIDKYGNTSAASVPIAMQEAMEQKLVEKGKITCQCAFGAGLSFGHFLVRV